MFFINYKKNFLFLILFFFYNIHFLNAEVKYVISTSQSLIKWHGKKVGGSQNGTISILYGNLIKKNNNFIGLIVVDMDSIDSDNFGNSDLNKKLINHLKSNDFFKVSKYPTSKLEITKCVETFEAIEDENKKEFKVYANLTIKDVTREIIFPIEYEMSPGGLYLFAKGKLTIDRTNFNIFYNSGTFFKNLEDKMIYDDFHLYFYIKAKAL